MKRHISIDIKSALANDITVLEWCLLECIHFSSNNETGYCYASKEQLRNHIGVSNGQIYKMIYNLEKRGLIKKHKDTGHLKTTEKWVQVERGDSLQKMENDSPKNGDEPLQKMETNPIKKEKEERKEERKAKPKKELFDSGVFSEEEFSKIKYYRSQIKASLKTQQAVNGLSNRFAECYKAGYSFDYLFELMAERQWKSIKLEWVQKVSAKKPVNKTAIVDAMGNVTGYRDKKEDLLI